MRRDEFGDVGRSQHVETWSSTMVCPMRFVVVGVSAVLALVLAWSGWREEEDMDRREHEEKRGRNQPWNGGKLVWDMFTGKYLYDMYCAYQEKKKT